MNDMNILGWILSGIIGFVAGFLILAGIMAFIAGVLIFHLLRFLKDLYNNIYK